MKNKLKIVKTSTIVIALLIVLSPMTTPTQATIIYDISWYQNPGLTNVREGEVIVTMVLDLKVGEVREDVWDIIGQRTEIRWSKNNIDQTDIKCDQNLPGKYEQITFSMGPFVPGTDIKYTVHLGLDNSGDYDSSEKSFTALSDDIPTDGTDPKPPSDFKMIYVVIGLSVVIALFLLFRWKKK